MNYYNIYNFLLTFRNNFDNVLKKKTASGGEIKKKKKKCQRCMSPSRKMWGGVGVGVGGGGEKKR